MINFYFKQTTTTKKIAVRSFFFLFQVSYIVNLNKIKKMYQNSLNLTEMTKLMKFLNLYF